MEKYTGYSSTTILQTDFSLKFDSFCHNTHLSKHILYLQMREINKLHWEQYESKIEVEKENQTPYFFFFFNRTRKSCVCAYLMAVSLLPVPVKLILKPTWTSPDFRMAASPIIWQHHPFRESLGLCCGHLLPAKIVDWIVWLCEGWVNLMTFSPMEVACMWVEMRHD